MSRQNLSIHFHKLRLLLWFMVLYLQGKKAILALPWIRMAVEERKKPGNIQSCMKKP